MSLYFTISGLHLQPIEYYIFLILPVFKEKTIFHIFSFSGFTSNEGDILLVQTLLKNRCSILPEILFHNSNFKLLKSHQFVAETTVVRL